MKSDWIPPRANTHGCMTLIQSNPCSTVVIKQDHSVEEPTFQRIYVCLSAHNISFMAGCRSVIGLDGCFFQGVTNGELYVQLLEMLTNRCILWYGLLLKRNATTHEIGYAISCLKMFKMYPLAWTVVENPYLKMCNF